MKMRKAITTWLGLCLLLAALPALAQPQTWQVDDSPSRFWQATVFDTETPARVQEALAQCGWNASSCLKGALLESISKDKESAPWTDYAMALVALEQEGTPILAFLSCPGGEAWTLETLGAKALLQNREFSITLEDVGMMGVKSLGMRFLVTYPRAEGGTESYGFWQGMGPLHVKTYERKDANGSGIAILNTYPEYGFRVLNLPFTWLSEGDMHMAYLPLWVQWMESITDFPTDAKQAKRLAEDSWKRFEGTDFAVSYGANLREKPTTRSKTFGQFKDGVLLHVLGEEKGQDAPWYHVRVGREEGWMSGVYVKFPNTTDFAELMWHTPVPVARTLAPCTLWESPEKGAKSVRELPKDAQMHVMAETEGGWLYVMIPQGDMGWEMDPDGESGYVRAAEVR